MIEAMARDGAVIFGDGHIPTNLIGLMLRRMEHIREKTFMLDITAAGKSPAPKTVTTKHLAYELAEQHQLTKKQAQIGRASCRERVL